MVSRKMKIAVVNTPDSVAFKKSAEIERKLFEKTGTNADWIAGLREMKL